MLDKLARRAVYITLGCADMLLRSALIAVVSMLSVNSHAQFSLDRSMRECAAAAVYLAQKYARVTLDYSPESLEQVDAVLNSFRLRRYAVNPQDDAPATFGCYAGQVMINQLGGVWREPKPEEESVVGKAPFVELPGGRIAANPINKAMKLYQNGLEDSLYVYYRVIASTVARQ